jgi:hypothetical protein
MTFDVFSFIAGVGAGLIAATVVMIAQGARATIRGLNRDEVQQ